jgi:hypothetical protein
MTVKITFGNLKQDVVMGMGLISLRITGYFQLSDESEYGIVIFKDIGNQLMPRNGHRTDNRIEIINITVGNSQRKKDIAGIYYRILQFFLLKKYPLEVLTAGYHLTDRAYTVFTQPYGCLMKFFTGRKQKFYTL